METFIPVLPYISYIVVVAEIMAIFRVFHYYRSKVYGLFRSVISIGSKLFMVILYMLFAVLIKQHDTDWIIVAIQLVSLIYAMGIIGANCMDLAQHNHEIITPRWWLRLMDRWTTRSQHRQPNR